MIKIDIISGFLGAGKTTLIKQLLAENYHGEKVVIFENEFGRINFDGDSLRRENISVESILSGCICCSASGSLVDGLIEIREKYTPDRIIIEPTGVAKLSDILPLIYDERLSSDIILEHVVTIIDTRNFHRRLEISKVFFENQVRHSPVILLNKIQNTPPLRLDACIQWISAVNPNCCILREGDTLPDIEANITRRLRPALTLHYPNTIDVFTFESENCSEPDNLVANLEHLVAVSPFEILRVKGQLLSRSHGIVQLEYVPEEWHITAMPSLADTTSKKGLRLCFIGCNLNKRWLEAQLNNI